MKKEEVEVPVYLSSISGYVKRLCYIAEDGEKFFSERDCLEHDEKLRHEKILSNVKKISDNTIFSDFVSSDWYLPKNEEELEAVKKDFYVYASYTNTYFYGNIEVGEWMGCNFQDNGDSRAATSIYTLSYLKDQYNDFIKQFFKGE